MFQVYGWYSRIIDGLPILVIKPVYAPRRVGRRDCWCHYNHARIMQKLQQQSFSIFIQLSQNRQRPCPRLWPAYLFDPG
jgi:hypothetical protein